MGEGVAVEPWPTVRWGVGQRPLLAQTDALPTFPRTGE